MGASLVANFVVLFIALSGSRDAEDYAALGYVGVATANFLNSATLFSPIPAFVATFLAASVLNPVILVLLSSSVVTVGESVPYFLGGGVNKAFADYKWHKQLRHYFYKSPFLFLVVWIGLPNPVQSLGQVFAGTVKYPFWKYSLATFLGNLIWFSIVVLSARGLFDWLATL